MKIKIATRLFAVTLCLALLAIMIPALPALAAATWYVDDSGGANFTTIQAAVTAAGAGDTIIVKDGTYVENVVIDNYATPGDSGSGAQDRTGLTIRSENGSATTIVQSADTALDVLYIAASWVTIDGFHLTETGASPLAANVTLTGESCSYCTIANNECDGKYYGIRVNADGGYHTISNNTCTHAGSATGSSTIYLNTTNNNLVLNNTCWNSTIGNYGIYIGATPVGVYSTNNTIQGNSIDTFNTGIMLQKAKYNHFLKNTVSHNEHGIYAVSQAVTGNTFHLNNFIGNTDHVTVVGGTTVTGNFWNSQEEIEYYYGGSFHTGYMGNYWDDDPSTDVDGDGIGDTPYLAHTSADEYDNYPLLVEYGYYFELPEPDDYSTSLDATTTIVMPTVGIEIDRDSVDYGNVAPGHNSSIETVVITNTGTVDCDVTLEVVGANDTAQSFYEASLYVDGALYDIAAVIATIAADGSEDVDTQLQVPLSWTEPGVQEATFVFWAEASP